MQKKGNQKLIYVLIFSISWSILILLNKVGLNFGAEPISWTIHTTFVSALILTIYILIKKREELKRLDKSSIRYFLILGFLVAFAYITGIYGLRFSTSINYSFLIKSSLVFTILLSYFFLKESLDKVKIALCGMFIIGAYLITTGGKVIVPQLGDLLTLLSSFGFSSAIIIQKNLTGKLSSDIIGWARITFALLFCMIIVPFTGTTLSVIAAPIPLIGVGIFNAVLAIYLNKTIEVSSASYMSMMSMVVPVINAVLGFLVLKESINLVQAIGCILILVSGILVQKSKI